MSEEKRLKELHGYKLELFDKIPYEITKNIPPRLLANMSIKELEQLNPHYKPPKASKEKRELTPQEQDLADIDALGHPKFKIDLEDPKFAKLDPKVRNIYKKRFENVSKQLEKELSIEVPEYTTGKMSMKQIPVPETIRYNPEVIVPIMTRGDIDTVDQEKKIRELREYQEKLDNKSLKDNIEIDGLKKRIKNLKTEVAKERGLIE